MKKLLVIFLLCVFGFSATGMTVHLHYCCGKLDDISLVAAADAKCGMAKDDSIAGKCGKTHGSEKKKCCDEKQVSFKVEDAYSHAQAVKLLLATYTLPKAYGFDTVTEPLSGSHLQPTLFAPPPLPRSLHILYCVYRI